MGVIEFELTRTVNAPIADVFARLSDIDGHNEWMPKKGSILRHTRQTSPGEPTLGTTFLGGVQHLPPRGHLGELSCSVASGSRLRACRPAQLT